LPAYMLPAAIVAIDEMPLTVNGKVDRKALPEHGSIMSVTGAGPVPARSEIERQIAEIWRELLGAQIGTNDNFFEVGGHSLLALQMHKRLSAMVGRPIPIMELFRHPTIRSLAEFIKGDGRDGADFSEMAIRMNQQREARAKRRNTSSSAKRT
jgi:acyl carrier protein